MSRLRLYTRNVFANYVGFLATLAVAFFLTPYIVTQLGQDAYGVWSLVVTLTGYFGIVDIGVRSGLGRFITFYVGREDTPAVNEVISTGMTFFCLASVLLMVVAAAISLLFPILFSNLPEDLMTPARWAVLLVALNVWVNLLAVSAEMVLVSHDRFELANVADLFSLAVRTGATVWVLAGGGGLVLLAAVQVGATLAKLLLGYALARRVYPALRISRKLARWSRFREILGFSVWSFVTNAVVQLMIVSDMVIISTMMGAEAAGLLAVYSIATTLINYAHTVLGKTGVVVGPEIIKDCSREDYAGLQWMMIRGCRLVAGACLLLMPMVIVLGDQFIRLWMPPEYQGSVLPMRILAVGATLWVLASVPRNVFAGFARAREGAILNALRLVLNIGTSIVFIKVFAFGLPGIAGGTALAAVLGAAATFGLALRWIRMPLRAMLPEVLRWAVLGTVSVGLCLAIDEFIPWTGWTGLFLKGLLCCLLYLPVGWYGLIPPEDRRRFMRKLFPGSIQT